MIRITDYVYISLGNLKRQFYMEVKSTSSVEVECLVEELRLHGKVDYSYLESYDYSYLELYDYFHARISFMEFNGHANAVDKLLHENALGQLNMKKECLKDN